jgi:hypothetical protein
MIETAIPFRIDVLLSMLFLIPYPEGFVSQSIEYVDLLWIVLGLN